MRNSILILTIILFLHSSFGSIKEEVPKLFEKEIVTRDDKSYINYSFSSFSLLKKDLNTSIDSVISLKGTLISGNIVAINYECLEGTNPEKFGYFVALWQGSQIMSLSRASKIQKIQNKTQDGSFNFVDLNTEKLDYTIGLGVNIKDSTSVSTTFLIPKEVKKNDVFTSEPSILKLVKQDTNSVVVYFETPAYNVPNQNKNWIALFEGKFTANFYEGTNKVHHTFIRNSNDKGQDFMDNIPGGLISGQNYTLVYGMGTLKNDSIDYKSIITYTQFKATKNY